MLERLTSTPGAGRWLAVSVLGLHRFYRGRSRDVVASWMTRQDREQAIADNLAYARAVVHAVTNEWDVGGAPVFAGFSQGVAMAFRAACSSPSAGTGVIALGGDVPPELDREALARIRIALVGRGRSDEAYAEATWERDVTRLRDAGVDVRPAAPDAGHEWTPEFGAAAGDLLAAMG